MLNAGCIIKELLFIKHTLYLCFALFVNFSSWSIRQHSRIINISEKFVDLNIAIKSLYSYIITYYASSLFTPSREKHGWITASLLLSLAFNKIVKIFVEGSLRSADVFPIVFRRERSDDRKYVSLCTDVPPPSGKIGRGDVCESPSLIVFRYTFA